jgi:hypothetical protein
LEGKIFYCPYLEQGVEIQSLLYFFRQGNLRMTPRRKSQDQQKNPAGRHSTQSHSGTGQFWRESAVYKTSRREHFLRNSPAFLISALWRISPTFALSSP